MLTPECSERGEKFCVPFAQFPLRLSKTFLPAPDRDG
jgi:hypothetical protein